MTTRKLTTHANVIGIYDAPDSERFIYRITANGISESDLASVIVVDHEEYKGCCTVLGWHKRKEGTLLASILLPKSVSSFRIQFNNKIIGSLSRLQKIRLLALRDCQMVNPGIDAAYADYHADCRQTVNFQTFQTRLVSIVSPLYKTPPKFLAEMIDSVLAQTYPYFELILVNASPQDKPMQNVLDRYHDERIHVISLEHNEGISGNTNVGIKQARGEYIAFLDHDDTLDPQALAAYLSYVDKYPNTDLFYCDEDNFTQDDTQGYAPRYKPDFNRGLLYSHNYIVHFLMVSSWALNKIELSTERVSGAQDYDLSLKVSEIARHIGHIPHILYHWRSHAGSTNGGVMESKPYAIKAGAQALDDHFQRIGVDAQATDTWIPCVYQITWHPHVTKTVTILLDSAISKKSPLLRTLESQIALSPHTFTIAYLDGIKHPITEILDATQAQKSSKITMYLSENIENIAQGFLDTIVAQFSRPDVGLVSPKLVYRDQLVAFSGYAATSDEKLIAINRNFTLHMGGGYSGFAECTHDTSCTSFDAFAVRTDIIYETLSKVDFHLNHEAFVLALSLEARSQSLAVMQSPEAMGQIYSQQDDKWCINPTKEMEQVWNTWAEVSKNTLDNPHICIENGYPRLNTPRNDEKDAKRLANSRLRGSVTRIFKH